MITPKQVYDAYPDNDLLGFDPPREGESYRDYKARLELGDWECLDSDRLFHFLLAELCTEDIDEEEADRRLNRANGDIWQVQTKLLHMRTG